MNIKGLSDDEKVDILNKRSGLGLYRTLDSLDEIRLVLLKVMPNLLDPTQPGYYNPLFNEYEENLRVTTGGQKHHYNAHRFMMATAREQADALLLSL